MDSKESPEWMCDNGDGLICCPSRDMCDAFYGSIMDNKQAEAVACDMKYISDQTNLELEITTRFFGKDIGAATRKALGYVEQQRELDPT